MAEEMTKRDQVKECIAQGDMTKAEIAEKLEMSAASVSTQMTYLRWMGFFIVTNEETKVLSFTDEETFNKLEAEKKANRKSSGSSSTRSPEERSVATAKTIANQEKQLAKWEEKLAANAEILKEHPDDEDAILNEKEASAQVALLEVRLIRNRQAADELPDPKKAQKKLDKEAAAAETSEEVVEEASGDLL